MTERTGIKCSRVGLGTASIMRLTSARRRRILIDAALASGISHFDTARMYGLGQAERELGRSLGRRRDQVTIATKFGIAAGGRFAALGRFQAPARALMERFPAVRGAIKRRSDAFAEPRHYDLLTARSSLETSLRELGTDYVDFLFIHDPTPIDRVDTAALHGFFEDQRRAGTIRAWGVSQDLHPELTVIDDLGPEAVLQVRDDVLIRPEGADVDAAFTFGVLGRAHAQILTALRADPSEAAQWRDELGVDPLADGELAKLLLADAFAANPHGTVIYSTLKPERLPEAVGVADQPRREAVSKLRELVARDRARLVAKEI